MTNNILAGEKMKCVAIVLAAGQETVGEQDVPKPFVIVQDKPVLIYTLEVLERHPQIDAIEVVCLKGWEQVAKVYAKQYNIGKLKWITEGGTTIQETIHRGLISLENELGDDDIVIIHDGIRPLVEESVLTDVILVAREKGNAVSSMSNNEQVFVVNESDPKTTKKFIPREMIRRVTTPQAYHFTELYDVYQFAFKHQIGIEGPSYADTLFADLGKHLYFSAGSDKNIKLNTEEDIEIFEAYLGTDRDPWLK